MMIIKRFKNRELFLEYVEMLFEYGIDFKVEGYRELDSNDRVMVVIVDDIDKDRLGFRSLRDFRTGMEVEEVDYQITDDEVGLE